MTNSRFVVITPSLLRVFDGRKFVAEYKVLGEFDAIDVETIRVANNALEITTGVKP